MFGFVVCRVHMDDYTRKRTLCQGILVWIAIAERQYSSAYEDAPQDSAVPLGSSEDAEDTSTGHREYDPSPRFPQATDRSDQDFPSAYKDSEEGGILQHE